MSFLTYFFSIAMSFLCLIAQGFDEMDELREVERIIRSEKNSFSVFNLESDQNIDLTQLKKSYRRLLQLYHPDRVHTKNFQIQNLYQKAYSIVNKSYFDILGSYFLNLIPQNLKNSRTPFNFLENPFFDPLKALNTLPNNIGSIEIPNSFLTPEDQQRWLLFFYYASPNLETLSGFLGLFFEKSYAQQFEFFGKKMEEYYHGFDPEIYWKSIKIILSYNLYNLGKSNSSKGRVESPIPPSSSTIFFQQLSQDILIDLNHIIRVVKIQKNPEVLKGFLISLLGPLEFINGKDREFLKSILDMDSMPNPIQLSFMMDHFADFIKNLEISSGLFLNLYFKYMNSFFQSYFWLNIVDKVVVKEPAPFTEVGPHFKATSREVFCEVLF